MKKIYDAGEISSKQNIPAISRIGGRNDYSVRHKSIELSQPGGGGECEGGTLRMASKWGPAIISAEMTRTNMLFLWIEI